VFFTPQAAAAGGGGALDEEVQLLLEVIRAHIAAQRVKIDALEVKNAALEAESAGDAMLRAYRALRAEREAAREQAELRAIA
jgi:hypothetical protein